MGRWAGMQVITRELREDASVPADEVVGKMMRRAAEAQGYRPVGEPLLTWHEIDQHAVDVQESVNGGPAYFKVGDWFVRAVIEVSEDTEIGP